MNFELWSCSLISILCLSFSTLFFALIFSNNSGLFSIRRHKFLPIFTVIKKPIENNPSKWHRLVKLALYLAIMHCTQTQAVQSPKVETIILSKGEQKTLKTHRVTKFSIGNKQIIGHRFQKNLLLLKGKAMGYSDLILWHRPKSGGLIKRKMHIFVLSKKQQMKKVEIINAIKEMGLKAQFLGKKVVPSGSIDHLNQYLVLKELDRQYPDHLILTELSIKPKVQRKVLAKVYRQFFDQNLSSVNCQFGEMSIVINCYYDHEKPNKKLESKLKDDFFIRLLQDFSHARINHFIKFKFLLMTTQKSTLNNNELNSLSGNWQQLINGQISNALDRNFGFSKGHSHLKVFAAPEMTTKLNVKNTLSLGAEIPYDTIVDNQTNKTEWKFIGLRLNFHLHFTHNSHALKYSFNFSRPKGKSITGQAGQSEVWLRANQWDKILHISMDTLQEQMSSAPLIDKIPFLSFLFSQSHEMQSNQYLIVLTKVITK